MSPKTKKDIDFTPNNIQRIPVLGIVDVTDYIPILNHEIFDRLRKKNQLGYLFNVYPGAVHSRYEHSLGVFEITRRMADQLRLDEYDKRAVMAFALLHDVGHDPFSHNVEPLFSTDHDERGLELMLKFEDALVNCGVDADKVFEIARKENPLHNLVKSGVITADQLDYLARDAYHIGRKDCPDIDNLINFLVFDGEDLMSEEKNINEVMRTQLLYYDMHQVCYYIKQYAINKRMLQRAVQENMDAGLLNEDEIHKMVDFQLEERLENSDLESVRELFKRLKNRPMTYKSSVVFKLNEFCCEERIANKPVSVYGINEQERDKFLLNYKDPEKLTKLEDELCLALGYDKRTFLITSIFDGKLRYPKDTMLYSRDGSKRSLLKSRPAFRDFLIEKENSTFYIRVIVKPEQRKELYAKREKIKDFIKEKISSENYLF